MTWKVDVKRQGIVAEFSALDVQSADARECRPVPPHPRRGHAIEQVDPSADRLDDVFREPYPHQIPRSVTGQGLVDDVKYFVHRHFLFAD